MGLYLQMAGRALRPAAGKEDCVLLDHGGCVYRHGLVDCDRIWSLDGDYERRKAAKRIKDQQDLVKVCPDCDRVAELCEERCSCGYVFSKRSRGPKQVSGELELVTDAKPISDDEKRRKYEWWLTEQTTKRRKDGSPYSPAYAVVKFRAMYGHPPKRGWREDWELKNSPEFGYWLSGRLGKDTNLGDLASDTRKEFGGNWSLSLRDISTRSGSSPEEVIDGLKFCFELKSGLVTNWDGAILEGTVLASLVEAVWRWKGRGEFPKLPSVQAVVSAQAHEQEHQNSGVCS
jgi:hypothetical protein